MLFVENCGYIATSVRTLPEARAARPETVAEAVATLSTSDNVALIAGGTDLPAKFNEGFRPADLIDLSGIASLKTIERTADGLLIGAAVTHYDGARHPLVTAYSRGFAAAWSKIANVRVRFSATIGGNVMARRTRYEGSILLSALGAKARLADANGTRDAPVETLWSGVASKSLLVALVLPERPGLRFDYERSLRPIMTQAVAYDDAGIGRVVTATEYAVPAIRALGADHQPQGPLDLADPVTSADYLQRVSATFLSRQLRRMAS